MTAYGRTESAEVMRARLDRVEREAASRQRQLERCAAHLRKVFKRERARAQELRLSYMATVRALSNAVEARNAYTGKHAERVAAFGLELARGMGLDVAIDPRVEFGFLLHDVGKVAVPRRDPVQAGSAHHAGAGAHGAPPRGRRGDPARRDVPGPGDRRGPSPPRALGRRWLSRRAGRRGDPPAGADLRGRRRAHYRPAVPPRGELRPGAGGHRRRGRDAVRPHRHRGLRRDPDATFATLAEDVR